MTPFVPFIRHSQRQHLQSDAEGVQGFLLRAADVPSPLVNFEAGDARGKPVS